MVIINWTNVTDFGDIPALANTATGGSFWVGILFMMWLILMILMSFFGFEVAIVTASFLALIMGLVLVYAGLVAWAWLMVFVGILLFMFLYIIWSTQKNR